ncbi:MAG: hypothetical protein J5601_03150 [Elusimicrobiaceae bacterium]|nr:hypothetical protein [Elusimicrobiaceae bacterium]
MKSICNEAPACCPNACEPFDVEYWSLVRADQDPDLKDAALGGELNLVRCPQCGTYFHHNGELIYFDSSAELLIFVFAKDTQEKQASLRKRMERDYEIIKNTLLQQLEMDYPPILVFGLDELQERLHHLEEMAAESEVVAASCAAQGLSIARLKPSYAREHHFPLYVPVLSSHSTANDYAVAASKVLKSGLKSTLLLHFKDMMSQEGAELPKLA